eukprot:CAMPEP_0182441054 /NCGR_PEP_ID=MMETSP1167-20130531/86673_1 /TAXON_ID=2988 /ORGANISM="Mallomonas Sp, Strain CCMP3275" /LENGTH=143 /DNA_ID=CAMNT_0024635193 /DNA_START=560 /DNA_END=991 /DNA_ORIENTATION=-
MEITGEAGDVVFMHPHLLHARSSNLGAHGKHSIRYMCHPTVVLKNDMDYSIDTIDSFHQYHTDRQNPRNEDLNKESPSPTHSNITPAEHECEPEDNCNSYGEEEEENQEEQEGGDDDAVAEVETDHEEILAVMQFSSFYQTKY